MQYVEDREPDDYIISKIPAGYSSDQVFTPCAFPRQTQPTLGKFLLPVFYKKERDESESVASKKPEEPINPLILKKWSARSYGNWVGKPEEDSYLVHELFRKINRYVDYKSENKYCKQAVFPRSARFETSYIDDARLKGTVYPITDLKHLENISNKTPEMSDYETLQSNEEETNEASKKKTCLPDNITTTDETAIKRWQQEPSVTSLYNMTYEQRMAEMQKVNQPFKTEMCNWFGETFPRQKLPDLYRFPKKVFPERKYVGNL